PSVDASAASVASSEAASAWACTGEITRAVAPRPVSRVLLTVARTELFGSVCMIPPSSVVVWVRRAPPKRLRQDRILREVARQTRVPNSSATGPDDRVPVSCGILTASGDLPRVRDRFGLRLTGGQRRECGDLAIVDDGCVARIGGCRDDT